MPKAVDSESRLSEIQSYTLAAESPRSKNILISAGNCCLENRKQSNSVKKHWDLAHWLLDRRDGQSRVAISIHNNIIRNLGTVAHWHPGLREHRDSVEPTLESRGLEEVHPTSDVAVVD